MKKLKERVFLLIVFTLAGALWSPSAVCAGEELTFWTTEVEKDRVDTQRDIAAGFEEKAGISVKVVPVEENMLPERVTAAYAAKSLPDVLYHPIDYTMGWAEAGILRPQWATEVIRSLGEKTFGEGPLNLVVTDQGYAAVPIDGWSQLLLYRKDLFQKKGLAVPDRWETIFKAAEALHNPPQMWGCDLATDPGQTYTQQVFEHFALSNGVRLVGKDGKVCLNTPEMIETLQFYKRLTQFGPPGNIYWLQTRMDYLSGRAAMIIWSAFILDELSGLRKDQPVAPDMAAGQPGFLAQNTGFVSAIQGPNGRAQYGQANCLGITVDADSEAAGKWIGYLLSDAYLHWLSMAAEGKLPVRKGTLEKPNCFVDGWRELEFSVTSRVKISQFYGMDVVEIVTEGLEGFDRWGFVRGKGALISKVYGSKVVPELLKRFIDGEMSAEETAQRMEERIKALE